MPDNPTSPNDKPVQPASGPRDLERLRQLDWMPCVLSVGLEAAQFTVRDLLRLQPGSIVSTSANCSSEIPLYANGQRIGSGEFEVVAEHMAARVTELV
ncbi:MAG TPA: FliM/FliN family flagellar motor C-terminal domain-containing protein [Chloroflexota bacterium]|nr:FliM/FliN family flagellar motor C-terminal domain-containing protein [Chloroflexota bacterium]